MQCEDGSFKPSIQDEESDMRFVYCACAVAHVLDLWSCIDICKTLSYIRSCITYEGGFALHPGCEAQGGATYCAVASLVLLKQLNSALSSIELEGLISWCSRREQNGFEGRTGKEPDSCYSFWIGATLQMLGVLEDSNHEGTQNFLLLSCQRNKVFGGFSKQPEGYPDLLHSFYSIAWLSLTKTSDQIKPINPAIGVCCDKLSV